MTRGAGRFEDLYGLYLARLREIRLAMYRRDQEALRSLELELGSLAPEERHVVAMAVHDVAARRPRLSKKHFLRTLGAEDGRPGAAPVGSPAPPARSRRPG